MFRMSAPVQPGARGGGQAREDHFVIGADSVVFVGSKSEKCREDIVTWADDELKMSRYEPILSRYEPIFS